MGNIISKKVCYKYKFITNFFVFFSLIFSENVFAQKCWTKENVEVVWDAQNQSILMIIDVYDYKFGPNSEHAYLKECTFKYSVGGTKYFRFMEISTHSQPRSNKTTIDLKKKLNNAQIQILNNAIIPEAGAFWPDNKNLRVTVRNSSELGKLYLGWNVGTRFSEVQSIRISGIWHSEDPNSIKHFDNIVYDIIKPGKSMLKSKIPGINAKVSRNEIVNVFKDSEAVVIKGADLGAKIKVYSTSGAEIKSVISNTEIVKIKLPEKQIYFVHIGKSRYRVIM